MARGKYAAKAANARAEESQAGVDQLRNLLATERRDRAREAAELNGRIAQLHGRLTTAVRDLAEQAIEEAKAEAREIVTRSAEDRVAAGVAVHQLLNSQSFYMPPDAWNKLDDLLGITMRDVGAATVADRDQPGLNRREARAATFTADRYTNRRRAGRPLRLESQFLQRGLESEVAARYGAASAIGGGQEQEAGQP